MKTSAVAQEYIFYKKALGFVCRVDTYRLEAFVQHVGDPEMDSIQRDDVQTFLEGRWKNVSTVWFEKFSILSGFFKYASSRGYLNQSLLPTVLPKKPGRYEPSTFCTTSLCI